MDIKDLRIFSRVAAAPNLSSVATALGISAGTVSKRIQALEDDLGVRLIDRTTRSSRLTVEGRMFLERAERILGEVDQARDEITQNASRPSGRITITAPASLARNLVTPAILSFSDAFPDVEVRVDLSDHVANLHEQGYDAAIRFGTLPDSTLKAKRLANDRIILVAAPAYLHRRGTPASPADLESHDCLIHGEQRNWTLIRGPSRTAVRVGGRIVSDNGAFLQSATVQGAGLMRTSEIAVLDDLAAGRLVRVLSSFELATEAAIWAVYPNVKHSMPRLRALLDHLAGYCREHLGQSLRAGPAKAMRPSRALPN